MKNQLTKEVPLFDVTKEEIVKYYQLIYVYLLDLQKKPNMTKRDKAAVQEPAWGAAEILYLALYGYTKKTKWAKRGAYIRWNRPPKTLHKRVKILMGMRANDYFENQGKILETYVKEAGGEEGQAVNAVSFEFRTDNKEVLRRMQKYIDDFDLHSSIDQDILKNLINTQMMIEHAQARMLKGEHTLFNVKELTDQLKSYTMLLGLSKKDRVDLGSERKKGSIAELASVYEETLLEYPQLEHDFFIEELEMLLDKYDRLDHDGNREISAKTFKVVSGGYTLEEARELTGRKRKNVKNTKGSSSNP